MIKIAFDGSLNFDTKIDTSGFTSGTNTIKSQANGLKSTLLSLGKTVAVVFGVKQLINFSKQAIDMASDLQEVQNVVDVAFGDMSYKMEEFASKSIETFGISKLAAKQTGSTYMAMAKGMGLASGTASDMAIALTGLSADMSSFYNVSQDVASTALKSIFTGETETLKQYGIVMTEANLQEYALSQGINKKISAMSQAEKVQLRYAFVMQQTALAQGDFARTSDSWANQTRVLSEKWKEFLGIIGKGLIQVLTPVVKFISTALSNLISFANAVGSVLSSILGIKTQVANVAETSKSIAASTNQASSGVADLGDSVSGTSKKVNKSLGSMDELNSVSSAIADSTESASDSMADIGAVSGGIDFSNASVGTLDTSAYENGMTAFTERIRGTLETFTQWVSTNFGPIFSTLWTNLQPQFETFKNTLTGMFTDIQGLWQPFLDYVGGSFTPMLQEYFTYLSKVVVGVFDSFNKVFSDIWNIAIYPILEKIISVVLPVFTDMYTQVISVLGLLFDGIKGIFDTLWNDVFSPIIAELTKIWCDFVDIMAEWWNKWGQPIFDNLRTALTNVGNTLKNFWESIAKPIWDNFMVVVDELWTNHLKPFIENVMDLVGELVNGALEIYNKFISPIVNWFVKTFGPLISNAINTVINVIGSFLSGAIDVASDIITTFKGIVQFITGVFTGDWKKAWTGIKNIFKGIFDSLVDIVKTPINMIIDIINGMVGGIVAGVNTVIKAINSLSIDVPDWVPGIGGETIGFNLKELTAPKIPKLATGTVVPANYGNFLSILGDNKTAPEVVSPLPTMKQAFKEALSEMGGSGSETINLNLYLEGKMIHSEVVRQDRIFKKQTGKSAFE